ncbi:hypothetical protein BJY52DRAFT_835859 [Lactarius psammicola]|nr:hypothetical protein BJY52DRAFT_835859 [Lactarius psammicola]
MPHTDTLEFVNSWLGHHSMPSNVSKLVDIPVSQANILIGASRQLYWRTETNKSGLPAALRAHVQTVAPTTRFDFLCVPREKPLMRRGGVEEFGAVLSNRDDYVTIPLNN